MVFFSLDFFLGELLIESQQLILKNSRLNEMLWFSLIEITSLKIELSSFNCETSWIWNLFFTLWIFNLNSYELTTSRIAFWDFVVVGLLLEIIIVAFFDKSKNS